MDMKVFGHTSYDGASAQVTLNGTCPYCRKQSVFICTVHIQKERCDKPEWLRWYSVMKCQGCAKLILGLVLVKEPAPATASIENKKKIEYTWVFEYEAHYPLTMPDDSMAEEIPDHIAADFSEALRCKSVKAFNAAVEMCRRSIEASCLGLGAKPKQSITQKIDWVHKQGRINKTLKNAAHKIRLAGNRGSHPSITEPPISDDEASAVIEFTRHYFDHVYVVEQRMGKYDFSKSGRKTPNPVLVAPPAAQSPKDVIP